MKIVWNKGHPERTVDFHIGDNIQNVSSGEIYRIVGWTYCDWEEKGLAWNNSQKCKTCKRAKNLPQLGKINTAEKGSKWGWLGTKSFCLGSTKLVWKKVR